MGLSETLKAISDPRRRQILEMLREGRRPAGEIAERFELSNATVSHHLSILRQADLVSVSREGTYVYYELNASVFEDVLRWIYDLGGVGNEAHTD